MIVGDGTYVLQGSSEQKAIVLPVFSPGSPSFIGFPWGKLTPPAKPIPIGWMDLNHAQQSGAPVALAWRGGTGIGVDGHDHGIVDETPSGIPGHVHVHDEDGNEGHGILRKIEGRWWIAGVFWTDGRIYVDTRCEQQPDVAREVVSAELAHSVDYFLPLSDFQKAQLMDLWHEGDHVDPHTWWEIHDYGAEYYTLGGEAFMAAFTQAYSAMEPDQSAFTHKTTDAQAAAVRTIVGFDLPEKTATICYRIGSSRKYHRESCWVLRFNLKIGRSAVKLDISSAVVAGLTACRFCD